MASSRFSLLAASLAILLLATATSAFARHYAVAVTAPPPTCDASTLNGFAKQVKLTNDGLFLLHWNVTKDKKGIVAAIQAKTGSGGETGWVSVGWTKKKDLMMPADVVVGNLANAAPNNVLAYNLKSKTALSQNKKTGALTLSAKSVASNADGLIVKFTVKTGKKGVAPPKYTGYNNMIWAYNDAKTFNAHSNRGSISVHLGCTPV
ncbi:hypothetical protein CLOM_g12702 [Closterium sp. NIES-68]|nr:hypothetical protein CLOM_g12702 [Closterium sp. NIES-68]GJP79897.1 hypothetical protein CLOP_g10112 [Closterium sp. NIES-67]